MLFSAGSYIFNYELAVQFYTNLEFPLWMIYPSAVLKILAVVSILTKVSKFLKEWAYAGLFFDLTMAFTAHTMVNDGMALLSILGFVFFVFSYLMDGKLYGNALLQPGPNV